MSKKYFIIYFLAASLALFSFPKVIQAQEATLYLTPSSGTFTEGESFWLKVMVNTQGQTVNAVAAYLSYPEDKLQPLGVSTVGSAMTIWAEKEAGAGKVNLVGGLPTPGFSGIKTVASVGFKAKTPSGAATLKFGAGSVVLRDADNKDILSLAGSGQGSYSFKLKPVAPSVPPSTPATPAPVISDVLISQITRESASISWKTDLEANSLIEYGLTSNYGFSVADEQLTRDHSLAIADLSPATVYHFKIISKGEADQEVATGNAIFSTIGYITEIQILSTASGKPVAGADVSLAGSSQAAKTTDQEGRVVFNSLSAGKQVVSVNYQKKTSAYPIVVLEQEEVQRFKLNLETPLTNIKGGIILALIIIFVISVVAALFWAIFDHWRANRKAKGALMES